MNQYYQFLNNNFILDIFNECNFDIFDILSHKFLNTLYVKFKLTKI